MDSHDIVPGILSIDSIRSGGLPTSNAHWPYPIVFPLMAWPFFQLFDWLKPNMDYFTVSNEIAIFSMKMPMIESIVPTTFFLLIWKLVLTITNIIAALVIAETFGVGRKLKQKYFFLVSLNPISVYLSSVTGQIDGFMLDLFLISLCMMHMNRWVVAGVVMGLAVGVKGYILSIFITITIGLYFGRLSFVEGRIERELFWKYFISVGFTGIILLLIQTSFSGDLLFQRGISDRVYRPTGISLFSLDYLNYSEIINIRATEPLSYNLKFPIYKLLSFLSNNFIITIIFLSFLSGLSMKIKEQRGRLSLLSSVPNVFSWQGLIAIAWATIFIQIGNVNSQYITLISSLCVFSWITYDSGRKRIGNDEILSLAYIPAGYLMAIAAIVFHLCIMSPISLFIPSSINLTLVDIDFLINTIDLYYFSESTIAANRHEATWGIIGPITFLLVTFEVIFHCRKIKVEGRN